MDTSSVAGTDFSFAFDNCNFSDRILRIQIVADCKPGEAGCSSVAEWARTRKRRREDIILVSDDKDTAHTGSSVLDIGVERREQILNCDMQEIDDGVACDNQEEEAVPMIEEFPSDVGVNSEHLGNEAGNNSNSAQRMDCSTILSIKTIHISSPILAAKSPLFLKLFSNRLRESEERVVTLRINASEEAAMMDVLYFMYSNTLSAKTPIALLDVLMIADKFEVASCMRYCSSLLRDLPMTCEYALLYLDLPFSVEEVQLLTDAAKQFLAAQYKDIIRFRNEVLNLPLAGIDAVLASNDLQVTSEDAVYNFVLKWARLHYPKVDERREIIGSRLIRLIRFPYMSCRRLKKVLSCKDFDQELAKKAVLEALFFKADAPCRQRSLVAKEAKTGYQQFVKRAYKYHSIKMVDFELPSKQCIIYLDLKHAECIQLYPAGRIYSQAFHLGGQAFVLSAHCSMDQENSFHCFGLFLGMQEKKSIAFAVDYEFAARSKASENFVTQYKGNYTFTGGKAVGYRNLFGVPWTKFIAADSPYFINETLHLRAEMKIQHTD